MRFLLLLFVPLLFSCNQQEFSISSSSLRSESHIDVEADGSIRREDKLILSAAFSIETDNYTFSVTSPDGSLTWEGPIEGEGVRRAELEITPGALFPTGTYSARFYSDQGTELAESFEYSRDDSYPLFTEQGLSRSASVNEYNGDIRVGFGEKEEGAAPSPYAERAEISWIDRYGNSYEISQRLPAGASTQDEAPVQDEAAAV